MLSPLVYLAVLFAVAAYAFGRGRLDERMAAGICVLATIATIAVSTPFAESFAEVELGILVVDFLALGGFTWIALRSDRFWPLWVAGLQLTTILSHFLKAIEGDMLPQVYAAAERLWVYPIFLVIVVGTWRSHRRWALQNEHQRRFT